MRGLLLLLPLIRCKVVVRCAESVHRGDLRICNALYVNIHREADVTVPQDRLDGFVGDAERVKIRRKTA